MNAQRATNKNVPTANFFETDFSYRTFSSYGQLFSSFLYILLLFRTPKGLCNKSTKYETRKILVMLYSEPFDPASFQVVPEVLIFDQKQRGRNIQEIQKRFC